MTKRRYLPVSYDVAGKHVGIAGNGAAALTKLGLLAGTQARLTLYSPRPRLDLAAASARIDRVARYPDARDLAGTTLLFLATEDEAEDERLAALSRSLGIAVNVVDRPRLSDFAMPAIVDRGAVTVAIASDGAAPVLAQRVRALIDGLLPLALANLGELAGSLRSKVRERLSGSAARQFWWRVLDGRAGAAALAGDIDKARLIALADLDDDAAPSGKVSIVPAPEAADLLTLRSQRLMLCADVIVHDAGLSADLLSMARRDARRIPACPDAGDLLVRLARSGQQVVRLVGNLGPGEIDTLWNAGVAYDVLPGAALAPRSPSSLAA